MDISISALVAYLKTISAENPLALWPQHAHQTGQAGKLKMSYWTENVLACYLIFEEAHRRLNELKV
jgi:hypothetical protein